MAERQEQIGRYGFSAARYAALIQSALPTAWTFRTESEGPGRVQVERGLVFPLYQQIADAPAPTQAVHPDAVTSQQLFEADRLVDPLIELAPTAGRPAPQVVDHHGHRRPAYRGLLVYAWLQAFQSLQVVPQGAVSGSVSQADRWRPALFAWCKTMEADVSELFWGPAGLPAAAGAKAAAAAWAALALSLGSRLLSFERWATLSADLFTRLAEGQQPSGALLLAGPADSPETHWYHELVLLHAAASYAAQSGDAAVARAADRAADYHLEETEPDHATGQPWALFAFASNPRTQPLADQVLHGAMVHAAQGRGNTEAHGVSFLLLADALYCLLVTGH